MVDKANIYPKHGSNPTISNSDSSKANLAICFSGGGSRAMTCAWGQMLGLRTLDLIDKARYISSVSGGTWASSIYTYLPENISDDELLGTCYPPKNLSLTDGTGKLNVNELGKYSLGQAPAGISSVAKLVAYSALFLYRHRNSKEDYKWLWAFLVAKFILKPYGLRAEGDDCWSSSKYFSLSSDYVSENFPSDAPSTDDFFFVRSGRPFIVMNNNLMEKDESKVVQLPSQATPVSGGVQGQTPDSCIIGGGSVESYGYCSTLKQDSADSSPVKIEISQPYSLIDIVSTSSAFFADFIAESIQTYVNDPEMKKELFSQIEATLKSDHEETLFSKVLDIVEDIAEDVFENIVKHLESDIVKDLSAGSIIPTYNYWPIGKVSENREMEFTDGGTLENLGVLGLLAQTDTGNNSQAPISLVVFENTSTALEKKNGNIIAGSQAAPLFGIDFNEIDGTYRPFSEGKKDPNNEDFEATSLITVFDNSEDSSGNTPFDNLVKGLYAASCGATSAEESDDSKVNTEPAFYKLELTTVANSLANITAGRTVNIFYIQNAKILHWQDEIGDENLKNEIVAGQQESAGAFEDFKDFPYYSTFTKIGLEAKESNALSQMWAWTISDDSSPLKNQLQKFIENAAS